MAYGSIIGSLVSAAVMAAMNAAIANASKPKMGAQPDYASASEAEVEADVGTLAARRAITMAAALGKDTVVKTGDTRADYKIKLPNSETEHYSTPKAAWDAMVEKGWISTVEGLDGSKDVYYTDPVTGNKVHVDKVSKGKRGKPELELLDLVQKNTKVFSYNPAEPVTVTAPFKGIGDVDLQKASMIKSAQNMLDLQKKYGADFAQVALEQEKLADPKGWKARQALDKLLTEEQAQAGQVSPVSSKLYEQMGRDLSTGAGLSAEDLQAIGQTLAQRGALGDATGADIEGALTRGSAGLARESRARSNALALLQSGSTPEDIAYRRQQQSMSNIGSFLGGTSPVTQFASLSAAQSGTTPVYTGAALPTTAGSDATQAMLGAQQGSFQQKMQNMQSSASPWFTGLNAALKGANAVAATT